ncbi:MAG: homoserine dehydrogenase [bacterium]|nr:homoserine dehydrogenase [bacterium]
MSRKNINIGLFGFGCVGFGLYEVLLKTPGLKANINKICVKDKNKSRPIDAGYFTYDKDELLNDESINTIVELIDDADAAFEIVKTALMKGKAVVTANKKMIAEHFTELLELQKKYKVPLLYEAAVCASIPVIRNLEEYYDNDLLESLEGIVNGSTNYILTKTSEDNISYADALLDAQKKGYAESNPILDTGGFDAKYKLLILLAHAFGIVLNPEEIFNIGIDKISDLELKYAREKGYKIKLVAHAFKTGLNTVSAFVAPRFVQAKDKLFQVDDVYNGVVLETVFTENQFFLGKGAGAYPTASAVLSDISALSYNYQYEYKKLVSNKSVKFNNDFTLKIFLKYEVDKVENLRLYFSSIDESYQNNTVGYLIGEIEFIHLQKLSRIEGVSIIIDSVIPSSVIETDLANVLKNEVESLV